MPLSSRPQALVIDNSYISTLTDHSAAAAALGAGGGLEVNDPVHGTFCLGPICSLAVNTAPVQRLRYLSQLGRTSYGPFPSAVHTRYAHSLGTAHLAGRCVRHLAASAAAAGEVRELDVELTALAGLCHDLGHGPFSHSFDTVLQQLPGRQGQHWSHEDMSCKLLEAVLQETGLDLDSQQLQRVQDMIDNGRHRTPRQHLTSDAAWRLQIVSNATNAIDVDKLDYLVRDIAMTGVTLPAQQLQHSKHFTALMTQHCKVLSGQVCFAQQQQQTVAAVFDTRATLHERMYQHPTCKAAELMDADALLLAEPVINIRDKLEDPEAFLTLDDTIVNQIIASSRDKRADPCLREAAALLQRMQRSDSMYFLAAEAELLLQQPQQHQSSQEQQLGRLTVADVVCCQQQGGSVQLTLQDVRLYHYSINYCFGAEDPLEHVLLYDGSTGGGRAPSRRASEGIPRPGSFLSSRVRVYVARQCSSTAERVAYANAAAAAFSNALRARYGQHWQLLLLLQDSNSSSSRQQWSAAAADLMMQRSAAAAAVVLTPPQQTEQQLQQPWNLSQDDTTHGISSGDGVQRRGWRAGDATVAPLGEVDGVVAATASQWS